MLSVVDFKSRKITRKKNGWVGKSRRETISIKHKILHKKYKNRFHKTFFTKNRKLVSIVLHT